MLGVVLWQWCTGIRFSSVGVVGHGADAEAEEFNQQQQVSTATSFYCYDISSDVFINCFCSSIIQGVFVFGY